MGQPVGLLVQLPVGQTGVLPGHRDRLRRPCGLRLEPGRECVGGQILGAAVPVGQHSAALVRAQHVELPDGAAGFGCQRPQEVQEPLSVVGDLVRAESRRVAGDPQPEPGVLAAALEGERQVVDRTAGHTVDLGRAGAEPQAGLQRQEVDGGAEHPPGVGAEPKVLAQILAPVALVAQQGTEFARDMSLEVGERGLGLDVEAQRKHVGGHPRGGLGDAAEAAGDREPEHDVPGAGEAAQVRRCRRGQRDLPGRPCLRGQPLEVGEELRLQVPGVSPRLGPQAEVPVGQTQQLAIVREAVDPVGTVLPALLRGGVLLVLAQEHVERGEFRGRSLGALRQRRVAGGDPLHDEVEPEGIGRDVVDAGVPEMVVRGQLEQDLGEQRAGEEVSRLGEIRRHHLKCGLAGILALAQVLDVQCPVARRLDDLAWRAVLFDESDMQCLGLVNGLAQCALERIAVKRAANFHVSADVVQGARRIQPLGIPDSLLGRRQREGSRLRFGEHLENPPYSFGGILITPDAQDCAAPVKISKVTRPHRMLSTSQQRRQPQSSLTSTQRPWAARDLRLAGQGGSARPTAPRSTLLQRLVPLRTWPTTRSVQGLRESCARRRSTPTVYRQRVLDHSQRPGRLGDLPGRSQRERGRVPFWFLVNYCYFGVS